MNGIAVRVGRIKGRCWGDITGTVNYWVLVVRWTRSQIRGTSPLRMHEPKVCFDIFTSHFLIHDIRFIVDDMCAIYMCQQGSERTRDPRPINLKQESTRCLANQRNPTI
jgi:hypothetical protein